LPPLASGEKNESNQMDDFRAFRSEIIKSLFRRGSSGEPLWRKGLFSSSAESGNLKLTLSIYEFLRDIKRISKD